MKCFEIKHFMPQNFPLSRIYKEILRFSWLKECLRRMQSIRRCKVFQRFFLKPCTQATRKELSMCKYSGFRVAWQALKKRNRFLSSPRKRFFCIQSIVIFYSITFVFFQCCNLRIHTVIFLFSFLDLYSTRIYL